MKKNIGPTLALYPTPAVVVGAFVNDRLNWILVAHIGTMGHDRVVVSMHKAHHTNKGIEEKGTHQELMEKGGIYYHLYSSYADDKTLTAGNGPLQESAD